MASEVAGAGSVLDDALTRGAFRKIAIRFVPILLLAYVFNYLDRTCVGFAALTMNKDLGLTPSEFGFGAGIFFLGYSVFEVPSNMAMYRFGARRWLARILISWGFVSALTALAVGPNSFYAVRFILGIAEAGFFPGGDVFFGGVVPGTISHADVGVVRAGHPALVRWWAGPSAARCCSWMGCSGSPGGNGCSWW